MSWASRQDVEEVTREAGLLLVLRLFDDWETYQWRYSHERSEHPSIATCADLVDINVWLRCCENAVATVDVRGPEMRSSQDPTASPILYTRNAKVDGEIPGIPAYKSRSDWLCSQVDCMEEQNRV